jgi:hypothetical protein
VGWCWGEGVRGSSPRPERQPRLGRKGGVARVCVARQAVSALGVSDNDGPNKQHCTLYCSGWLSSTESILALPVVVGGQAACIDTNFVPDKGTVFVRLAVQPCGVS